MISGEDLEELWERAITVARVDLPNRYECVSLSALLGAGPVSGRGGGDSSHDTHDFNCSLRMGYKVPARKRNIIAKQKEFASPVLVRANSSVSAPNMTTKGCCFKGAGNYHMPTRAFDVTPPSHPRPSEYYRISALLPQMVVIVVYEYRLDIF